MKKNLFIVLLLSVLFINAQSKKEITSKYQRSSLCTVLMKMNDFDLEGEVIKSYFEAPFPDKYNNHNIDIKSFRPQDFAITQEERKAAGIKKATNNKNQNRKDLLLLANKFISKNQIAKKLISKWFNRDESGAFDMNLISERGFYNATDLQAKIASNTARGVSSLGDSGEELIQNTFVVISNLKFVKNEPVARDIRDRSLEIANESSSELIKKGLTYAAEKLYEKTKNGYTVLTKSLLYQLEWNETVSTTFYTDYWFDKTNIDTEKKKAFDETDFFKLNYIGSQTSNSILAFSKKGSNTKEAMIKRATIRNLDKSYAKLQKKYDVFKTKTPIYSIDPVTAQIGTKEGLTGGEKYEVLEQSVDSKTGKNIYKRIGIVKVDKKKIWDNSYVITEEKKEDKDKFTVFKGKSKKYYPGLLLRQIK